MVVCGVGMLAHFMDVMANSGFCQVLLDTQKVIKVI